jgi:hypothetical protein
MTQNELQLLVDTISMTPDAAEFMSAIQDNREVMYAISTPLQSYTASRLACSDSQEERITILKTALARKGVEFNSHYDLDDLQPQQPATTEFVVDTGAVDSINDDDHDGIHL